MTAFIVIILNGFLLLQSIVVVIATITSNMNYGNADYGGNRGYSLALHDYDTYLGVAGYFTPSPKWPTHAVTITAWVRVTGWVPMASRSFLLSMIAKGDTNHIQPFAVKDMEFTIPIGILSEPTFHRHNGD